MIKQTKTKTTHEAPKNKKIKNLPWDYKLTNWPQAALARKLSKWPETHQGDSLLKEASVLQYSKASEANISSPEEKYPQGKPPGKFVEIHPSRGKKNYNKKL